VKRQFLAIASSRLLAAAIQALVGIGLARTSGPQIYGEITAFMGVLVFLFIVCGFGLPSYTGRARALGNGDDVATALRLNVMGSLIGAIAVSLPLLLGILPLADGPILALLVVGTAFDKNTDAVLAVMIADGERLAPALNVLVRRVLTAGIFFGWLAGGGDPTVSYCVASAVGPAVGQLHASMRLRDRIEGRSRSPSKDVMRRSLPFGVNDVAIQSKTLDVVIVAAVTNPFTAGLYSAAAKLIAPSELAASTLAGVILPRASRMSASQQRSAALKLTCAALVMFPVVAVLARYAESIMVFLLGVEFRSAAPAFAVLGFTLPLLLLNSPVAALLQGMRREGLVALNSLVFALLLPVGVSIGAVVADSTGAAAGLLAVTATKSASLVLSVAIFSNRGG
jgi:O-antigen/teichoic acid export membrane protein